MLDDPAILGPVARFLLERSCKSLPPVHVSSEAFSSAGDASPRRTPLTPVTSAPTSWPYVRSSTSCARHNPPARVSHPDLAPSAVGRYPRSAAFFFDESEAQRLTLGPRLPHHRHRMTADEALAGLLVALVVLIGIGYFIFWVLHG